MILIDMNMPLSCQGCPAFATEACDKWYKHKTFSDQRTKRHNDCPLHENNAIDVLQEIRHEIETAQTYKIASGSHDLYIDRDNALEIIDSHVEQYKEDAE